RRAARRQRARRARDDRTGGERPRAGDRDAVVPARTAGPGGACGAGRRDGRGAARRRRAVTMATRGLTLLEVVVALAVLAVGITSLQRLVAGSVLAVGSDAALTRAMLAAESVLAEAAVHVPEPGHVEGDRPGPPPLH